MPMKTCRSISRRHEETVKFAGIRAGTPHHETATSLIFSGSHASGPQIAQSIVMALHMLTHDEGKLDPRTIGSNGLGHLPQDRLKGTEAFLRSAVAKVQSQMVRWQPLSIPFSERTTLRRILLITEPHHIAKSQIHPLWFYRWELGQQRFDVREVHVDTFTERPERAPSGADIVILQLWSSRSQESVTELLDAIRSQNPGARMVYFDSAAPTDLRMASRLGDVIDAYVKKSALLDRSKYFAPTLGDTNLTDYYERLYGIADEETLFPLPEGFLAKLHIGPGFFTSEGMLKHFYASPRPWESPKSLDVHARWGSKGAPWYTCMRTQALASLENIGGLRIASTGRVKISQYLRELASSRLCMSPFGYGEITWRDYEAIMCGALLLKPDMAHCETEPNIFVPYETYIPLRWDFSDTEEKVRYYLAHPSEANAISQRAYDVLHQYCRNQGFLQQIRRVLVA